jgi:hypothetical protein
MVLSPIPARARHGHSDIAAAPGNDDGMVPALPDKAIIGTMLFEELLDDARIGVGLHRSVLSPA